MLDALLEEEFGSAKRKAAGDKGLDLDAMIEAESARPQEKPITLRDVGNFAKTAVLPTLGNVAGAMAGSLTGPAAPIAVPALEAIGGMGGELLNQKLGITEPSGAAIAMQGILPPVMRGASVAKQVIPPSTAGAEFLNTIAPREAEHVLGQLGIRVGDASKAMSAATSQAMHIPAPNVGQVIREELDKMGGSAGSDIYAKTSAHLQNLGQTLFKAGNTLAPEAYQKELRDIRARLSQVGDSRPNQVEKAALVRVKEAMEDALLRNPAGRKLAGARHSILRESVFKDLEEMTYDASKNQAHQGTQKQFNARAILDKLEGRGSKANQAFKRRFEAAFEPEDQKLILNIYQKLNSFDKLAPGAGVNAGSMRILAPIGTGLTMGAAAHAAGASPGLASGITAAAMAVPPIAHSLKVFNLAMSTHEGRKELGRILADPKVKSWGDLAPRLTQFASAIEPVQTGIREMTTPTAIQPFPNER